jgi:hypothetical protein
MHAHVTACFQGQAYKLTHTLRKHRNLQPAAVLRQGNDKAAEAMQAVRAQAHLRTVRTRPHMQTHASWDLDTDMFAHRTAESIPPV